VNSPVELVNDSRELRSEDATNLSYWMVVLSTDELESDRIPKDQAQSMRGLIPTNCWCGSVLAVRRD
jgi:hypothetical protein